MILVTVVSVLVYNRVHSIQICIQVYYVQILFPVLLEHKFCVKILTHLLLGVVSEIVNKTADRKYD